MKNTYYDSSHVDAINFFEHASKFYFVFSSFSNIPKLNLAHGLTPALLFGFDKKYVNYAKLSIVAISEIVMNLAFHLFYRPFNAFK